jgi:hypothetical protein
MHTTAVNQYKHYVSVNIVQYDMYFRLLRHRTADLMQKFKLKPQQKAKTKCISKLQTQSLHLGSQF